MRDLTSESLSLSSRSLSSRSPTRGQSRDCINCNGWECFRVSRLPPFNFPPFSPPAKRLSGHGPLFPDHVRTCHGRVLPTAQG
eukprot:4153672-Prymnesium_polylepis.3